MIRIIKTIKIIKIIILKLIVLNVFLCNILLTSNVFAWFSFPAPSFPSTTHLQGPATGGETSTGMVFNPDDDYHLISADFNSGRFIFTITNSTNNSVDFSIIIPGSRHPSGIIRSLQTAVW